MGAAYMKATTRTVSPTRVIVRLPAGALVDGDIRKFALG